MTYFYDYFVSEYRERQKDKLLLAPNVMFKNIYPKDVENCRRVLKNSFTGYREGRNAEILKRLIVE